MPAAMESSQNIGNPLEIYIFLQISSKMFFYFWKSRKISLDLENLLRDLAGRARGPRSPEESNGLFTTFAHGVFADPKCGALFEFFSS